MGSTLLLGAVQVSLKTPTSGKFAFLKQPALHRRDEFQIYMHVTSQWAAVGVSLPDSWGWGAALTDT